MFANQDELAKNFANQEKTVKSFASQEEIAKNFANHEELGANTRATGESASSSIVSEAAATVAASALVVHAPTAATHIKSALQAASSGANFGLITLKTSANNLLNMNALTVSSASANSHAISSARNPNKLIKLVPDAVSHKTSSGKNNILFGTSNSNGNTDETNGIKSNLPSLVNLGILTPATSPKANNSQTNNKNNNSSNNSNSGNDGGTLPLTPISPNMSKNINFINNNNNSTCSFVNNPGSTNNTNHTNGNGNCPEDVLTEDT